MACIRTGNLLFLYIMLGVFLFGCGSGQDSSPAQSQVTPPSVPVTVLSWNPPSRYADNSTLDPFRDLDHYEVYVRGDGNFTDADLPMATVAAVKDAPAAGGNPAGKVLESEFILNNIQPFIGPGTRHYVSLKAVGMDGQKSAFMPPVVWDTI